MSMLRFHTNSQCKQALCERIQVTPSNPSTFPSPFRTCSIIRIVYILPRKTSSLANTVYHKGRRVGRNLCMSSLTCRDPDLGNGVEHFGKSRDLTVSLLIRTSTSNFIYIVQAPSDTWLTSLPLLVREGTILTFLLDKYVQAPYGINNNKSI